MINIPRDKLPLSLSHRGQMQCATGRYVDMDDDKADIMKYAVKAANEFPEAIGILQGVIAAFSLDGEEHTDGDILDIIYPMVSDYLNKLKDESK